MLVLTRRVGEKVLVGGDIQFVILAINGGQVRVGVAAPPNITVDREEIRERKDRDAKAS